MYEDITLKWRLNGGLAKLSVIGHVTTNPTPGLDNEEPSISVKTVDCQLFREATALR
jgi:hypothetical protein